MTSSRSPIRVGSLSFPTKQAAEDHIRAILWRYPPMGALTGDDKAFALALIAMHPSRDVITDCGIRSIHSQSVPYHEDQRRFLVRRTDESVRDFSWRNSLSPKSASKKLASILRHEAWPQVREFRGRNFRGRCEACGAPLAPDACMVDHAHPVTFERLQDGWLRSVHLTADDIAIVNRKGYAQHSYLEDAALTQSWKEYHEINARLRCVCRRCNLSSLRRLS